MFKSAKVVPNTNPKLPWNPSKARSHPSISHDTKKTRKLLARPSGRVMGHPQALPKLFEGCSKKRLGNKDIEKVMFERCTVRNPYF